MIANSADPDEMHLIWVKTVMSHILGHKKRFKMHLINDST